MSANQLMPRIRWEAVILVHFLDRQVSFVLGCGHSKASSIVGIICRTFSFHTCKRRERTSRARRSPANTRLAKIDCGHRLSFARQVWAAYLVKPCSLAQLRLDNIVSSDVRLWLVICDYTSSSRPRVMLSMNNHIMNLRFFAAQLCAHIFHHAGKCFVQILSYLQHVSILYWRQCLGIPTSRVSFGISLSYALPLRDTDGTYAKR